MTASRMRLDRHRWHFQHGPIDLLIEADGAPPVVDAAFDAAWARFTGVLGELVAELPSLKRPVAGACPVDGPIARRMWQACIAHRPRFVTPMAAVAGAVADEIVGFFRVSGVRRAWVNNGGDIALHLADGASARVGLFADLARSRIEHGPGDVAIDGRFEVRAASSVRGIATSGWRGRSLSLGIADSVTVLARTAADADAAATLIANAVDVDDSRIVRRPACDVVDDSDLGDRLVTVDVPPLRIGAVHRALSSGLAHADALRDAGIIERCALVLQGVGVTTAGLDDIRRVAMRDRNDGARVHEHDGRSWHGTRLSATAREAVA